MQVPQITLEHWNKGLDFSRNSAFFSMLDAINKAIEIALAEQSQEQPITADDVQLMAFNDCSDDWNDPKYREIWLEGYVTGAHAVIKHRSEA